MDDVFDLAIIGAGPAGMSAAIEASQEGLSVVLFDDQASPGGQIYRDIEFCPQDRLEVLGPSYKAGLALVARFRQAKIEYRPLHQVWSVDQNGLLYTSSEGSARRWRWRRLIVATGAMERAVPRKGWLLPGVRTVGSAQIMLKSGGFLPQEDTWIVGSGPLPLLFINQLHNAGVRIAGYVDTTPYANYVNALGDMPSAFSNVKTLWTGLKYQWRALRTGMRYVTGASEIAVDGDDRVSSLSFTTLGRRQQYATGTILVHDGVVPSVRGAGAIGCELEWNNTQRYFCPKINDDGRSSRDHVFFAGDAGGIEGAEAAESAGRIAALAIIQDLRGSDDVLSSRAVSWKKRRGSASSIRPFLDSLYAPEKSAALSDDTLVVCRCEGVTAGAVRLAVQAGAKGVNEVKAYTRAGMGPCQGSICAQIVSEIVANELGLGCLETGIFRTRPPIRAITVEQLSSL